MKILAVISLVISIGVSLVLFIFNPVSLIAKSFTPPGPKERQKAIGDTSGLADTLRELLEPDSVFEPIPAPDPHDWLAKHAEKGQTYDQYVHSQPNRPDAHHAILTLQPVGTFAKDKSPSLDLLKECAEIFFSMETQVLTPIDLKQQKVTTRINPHTKNRQILTGDVLNLLKSRPTKKSFATLAVTMEDMYPDPKWNFVFGEASLRARVGVFSFARYDPAFYGEKRDKNYELILFRRSAKVLVHEVGHMFGITHCIYFKCIMNGSNHLAESDSRHIHLCPVCLRKLQWNIQFDSVDRFRKLHKFYKKVGMQTEADWIEKRLKKINPC